MPDNDIETRTLEVRTKHEGIFQIDIPVAWKVTYSKVNPANGGFDSLALRVYEGEQQQRACFTDVVSFRDLSIPFRRRVKKSKEQTNAERGPKGRKFSHEESHDYEWVPEDSDAPTGAF
jgi:hypothetical protein